MLGIGFDLTASFAKGAWQGPRAVLEASRQVEFETPVIGKRLDGKIKIHNLGLLEFFFPKKLAERQAALETKKMIEAGKKELGKAVQKNKFLLVVRENQKTSRKRK